MSDRTYSEVIADELRAAGYSMGAVGYVAGSDRQMWSPDANRPGEDDRCIARADSELGAWVALEGPIPSEEQLETNLCRKSGQKTVLFKQ